MAQGVIEYKDAYGNDPVFNQNIQYFLDRFYLSRISIRMLINQHTLIFDGSTNPAHPKHIGSIDPNCSVSEVVKGKLSLLREPGLPRSPMTPPSLPGWRVTNSSMGGDHVFMGLMLVMPSVSTKKTACWVGHPISLFS